MHYRGRNDGYYNVQQEQGSIDLPQAFPDDGPPRKVKVESRHHRYNRRHRPSEDNGKSTWILTFALLTLVVFVSAYFLASEHEKVQIEHVRQDILQLQLEPLSREWEEKYARLQDENERLKSHEQEFKRIELENRQLVESQDQERKSRREQNKKMEYYRTYQENIHERIQRVSRTLVLEK